MKKATRTTAMAIIAVILSTICAARVSAAPDLEAQAQQADKNLTQAKTALQKAEYAFGQADALLDYEKTNGSGDQVLIRKATATYNRAKAIMELRQSDLAEAQRLDGELRHASQQTNK